LDLEWLFYPATNPVYLPTGLPKIATTVIIPPPPPVLFKRSSETAAPVYGESPLFFFPVLYTSGYIAVLPGYADGTIDAVPIQSFMTDSIATGEAVGDFNGDGQMDIAVSHCTSHNVSLHFWSTGNQWSNNAADTAGVPGCVSGIQAVDYDRNGTQDLIVSTSSPHGLSSLSGNGDGTFTVGDRLDMYEEVKSFTPGDFNHDGKPDVAAALGETGRIVVYAGDGIGHFSLVPTSEVVVNGPVAKLLAWDFDGVNGTDLGIIYDSMQARFTVLTNRGDATFDTASYFTELDGLADVVAGDISGDGVVDVAIASSLYDSIIVLTGTRTDAGSTEFCCPLTLSAGEGPAVLVMRDISGDGRLDLLSFNEESHDLHVFDGLVDAAVPTNLTVVSPNGGEQWRVGSEQEIVWTKGAGVLGADICVTRDGGFTWETVASNVADTSYVWPVTPPASLQTTIYVADNCVPTRFDVSDGPFMLSTSCCSGRVGDANSVGDDEPTIGDISVIIDALFISGSPEAIACIAEADVNQSGGSDPDIEDITIGDISILIDYLFITGQSLGLPDCN
jgi:hypothetical protein